MSNIDWFKFEDKDLDFPFYKKNPHIPKWGWIVLLVAMILGLIFSISSHLYLTILSSIIVIVPVLYFLKWDYTAIFQKPSLKHVALALALCVGYLLYAILMDNILGTIGIVGGNTTDPSTITFMTILTSIFAILTEEFVKFIPFMLFMRLIYKYSDNRKISVILSMIVTMVFFAFLHSFSLNLLLFALFAQGLGSIFEFVGYIKTKNIAIPYITHFCSDILIYALAIFGL